MSNKAARTSKEAVAPLSSPFSELLSQIQSGILPPTDALATAIANVQSKLAEWKPAGESDPFRFLFDQLNTVLEGIKALAEKNLDENLNKIIQQGAALVTEGKARAKSVADAAKPEAAAIKDEAAEVVSCVKDLSLQLLYSTEFRTFLMDCFDLLRDAGGIAIDKAKEATIAGVDVAADAAKEAVAETLSAEEPEVKGKRKSREASARKASKKAKELVTLSPADRQRLRAKFDSIARRANQNKALSNGFDSLMRIARLMQSAAHKGKRKAAGAVKEFDTTPLKNAWEETKKMLGKFDISGEPMENFCNDAWNFYSEISNSKPLSDLFSEIATTFTDAIKNPAILSDVAFGTRFETLTDRLRTAWADLKEGEAFSRAYNTLSNWSAEIAKNPTLGLASKAQSVLGASFWDEKGNFVVKTEMMNKMRELFVKLFIAQLKSLPLPKLEGSNETYDYCFEEMSLNLADLLPDQLHLTVKNDMDIDVHHAITQDVHGKLILTAANIKPSLTNVKFWFKRKGILSLEDSGKADVHLTGEGATITIRLDMDMKDFLASKQIFRVTDVFCVIDNLKIMVVEAEKHETLLSWLAPIISSRVKSLLEERIVISLRDSIERIEEGMSKLVEIAPAAIETVKEGAAIISHPITQGVPAAVNLLAGSKTVQG